jgi:hypothetical protein
MLPDFERAERIGEFWGNPKRRPSPSCLSTASRIGHCGRGWSGYCGKARREGEGSGRWRWEGDHSLLRVVPDTLTAAVLTFESWSGAVDHM